MLIKFYKHWCLDSSTMPLPLYPDILIPASLTSSTTVAITSDKIEVNYVGK